MNDVRTAQIALSQAMQTNPGTAASSDLIGRTLVMLAQILGAGGRSQALMADMMFQRAEKLDPATPKIAYHRGLARLAANEPEQAAILLERALQLEPGDDAAARALLLAYERSGQKDRGLALVEALRREGRLPPAVTTESATRPAGEMPDPTRR